MRTPSQSIVRTNREPVRWYIYRMIYISRASSEPPGRKRPNLLRPISRCSDGEKPAVLLQCMSPVLADFVEKVGVLTRPNFFSAVGAVFRFGRGGPHHPPQT